MKLSSESYKKAFGFADADRLTDRWVLVDRFEREVLSDPANGAAVMAAVYNTNFEYDEAGTTANGAGALASVDGCKIASGAANADNEAFLMPIDVDAPYTLLGTGEFIEFDDEPEIAVAIKTDSAAITLHKFAIGFQCDIAAPSTTKGTPADQACFYYAGSGNWLAVSSTAGTDTEVDTLVTPAASTEYLLEIKVNSQYVPVYYINGIRVATGVALANVASQGLRPVVCVGNNSTAAARNLYVRGIMVSKKYA